MKKIHSFALVLIETILFVLDNNPQSNLINYLMLKRLFYSYHKNQKTPFE